MDFKTRQQEVLSSWFKKGDSRINVRIQDDAAARRIHKEFFKIIEEFVVNPTTKRLERVTWDELRPGKTETDFMIAQSAALIIGWEKITVNGEPAKFSEEIARKLLAESVEFRAWFTESLEALTEQVKKEFGSAEPSKNSKGTRAKR